MLGGLAVEDAAEAGLDTDGARFTPSETEARGLAVVDDLSAETAASGEATEARGAALEAGAAAFPVPDVGAFAAEVEAFTVGVAAFGARVDCRRVGTGGGGIFLEAAAEVVCFVAGAAPALAVFLRAEVAEADFAAGVAVAVALVAEGVALTAPDPNVPELIIYRQTAE